MRTGYGGRRESPPYPATPRRVTHNSERPVTSRRMAVDSHTDQTPPTRWPSPFGVRTRLVSASALMLFTELALIRWTGSNVVHLSYFSNFVLLGSFLGIGIGILRSGRAKRLPYYSPIVLGLLVLVIAWKPVTVDRGSSSSVIYF